MILPPLTYMLIFFGVAFVVIAVLVILLLTWIFRAQMPSLTMLRKCAASSLLAAAFTVAITALGKPRAVYPWFYVVIVIVGILVLWQLGSLFFWSIREFRRSWKELG
jgi:ABC-type Fe3+-siderophore transport system permease subunit